MPRASRSRVPSRPPAPWQASRTTLNRQARIAGWSTISSSRARWPESGSSSRLALPRPSQRAQAKSLRLPAIEQGSPLVGAEHHPPALEELEAVVLGRIVRRRDLDSPGQPGLADQPADRRRRRGPERDGVMAGRRHRGLHGRREHRRRPTAVVPHRDRAGLAPARIGGREFRRDQRVQAVAHHAAQTRDAGNPRPRTAHRAIPHNAGAGRRVLRSTHQPRCSPAPHFVLP